MKPKTLTHYSNLGTFCGILNGKKGEHAPDHCLTIFEIEEDNPFYIISLALKTAQDDDNMLLRRCFDSFADIDFESTKSLLLSIKNPERYLAIPQGENSEICICDIWCAGKHKGHEPRYRFYLSATAEGEWSINRLLKLLPCDITVDHSGLQDYDEQTFDEMESEEDDFESYKNILPHTVFDFFLELLIISRNKQLHELTMRTERGSRMCAFVAMSMLQNIKRVVGYQSHQTGCVGVNLDGVLLFQHCDLDITAIDHDGKLLDYQFEFIRNKRWELTGCDNKECEN